MRRSLLLNQVSAAALVVAAVGFSGEASATCTTDASGNATCTGTTTAPLTIYDAAAAFQPVNGSNAYTPANPAYPAATNTKNPGYNPNPPTVFVTIDPTANYSVTTTAANNKTLLADNGIIVANYSNTEDPAVNNVTINNNGGLVALSTNQIGTRNSAIVADSQVNLFTVNNAAGGTISAAQTFFTTFNKALLTDASSNSAPPTPSTYTPRYGATTLTIVSSLYSDDNTNSFVVNNAGTISASGRYAAAYYGRADTTITNSGVLGNAGWAATDKIYDGHWAIGTYAGAEFATVAGSNPDTPIYDVQNITKNAQGVNQGTLAVTDTVATTVTNTKAGTINGDIIVLDTNPLVVAAAAASGQALPLAVSGSNSGPRDSAIDNAGVINGNFYLGSGDHQITNEAGAAIAGSINVDQRASVGTFAAAVPGTAAGTYASTGTGTGANGAACPAANANTTDPLCAKTQTVLASFVGSQTFALKNQGAIAGDIVINDQSTSVNTINLQGTGFSGNVIAVNGTGSNSLTLNGVTNLASVQNFSALNLNRSDVTVQNGVSLVNGSTLKTTIYGAGGTAANPSTKLGTIEGTLTLQGTTTLVPTFTTLVRDGGVYQVASAVAGPGASEVKPSNSALVRFTTNTGNGNLALDAHVRDPRSIPGISQPAGATLAGLVSYDGNSAAVRALGNYVEHLGSDAEVRVAGSALSPIINGADVQIPINSVMLFHQQIDSRLDSFIYAQLPVSGRSADLGPGHPAPVYGPPPNGAWIEGIGGGINQGTVNGVNGYSAELEGVIGGYDRLVAPGLRVGGAMGYINGNVNGQTNFGTRQDIQTYQGLVYATLEQANYYLRGSVGYGGVDFQSTRQIALAGFNDTAFGSHGGNIFTARGEGGVPYQFRDSLVVPYAAFTYSHLKQDAYSEQSNAGAAFNYQAVGNNSERSEVGGKLIVPIGETPVFSTLFPAGSAVALEGRAAYVHEFGNVAQTVAASFVGGGNIFVAAGPVPSRDMVDYGVGLRMGSGPAQIDLSYNGLARSSFYQQVGLLRLRYNF